MTDIEFEKQLRDFYKRAPLPILQHNLLKAKRRMNSVTSAQNYKLKRVLTNECRILTDLIAERMILENE